MEYFRLGGWQDCLLEMLRNEGLVFYHLHCTGYSLQGFELGLDDNTGKFYPVHFNFQRNATVSPLNHKLVLILSLKSLNFN